MKQTIFLFLIILLSSCKQEVEQGLWIGRDVENYSFDLININDSSSTVRFLSTMNYWVFDKDFILQKNTDQYYSNDSLQLKMVDSSGMNAKYFKHDKLVDQIGLDKILSFNKSREINKLKSIIENKVLYIRYNSKIDTVNILDNGYSYEVNEYHNVDNYDIFVFGKELFLITNTNNFFPIHITSIRDNLIEGQLYTFEDDIEVNIKWEETPLLDQEICGKWISNYSDSNSNKNEIEITISSEYLILHRKDKNDSTKINTLSFDGMVVIINESNRNRPFLLEITRIDSDSIEITNHNQRYRNNKTIKYGRK
ncbi:MAG: hypothetical protein ACJATI_005325 [Halioglobus sp.]|jgi:hypothetical protein